MGRKGEETKQNIRAAALALFEESGYSRVTMQDICTKCGLSKGGLYRHYEDKSQIFIDILKMLQEEETDAEKSLMEQGMSAIGILEGFWEHTCREIRRDAGTGNINMALYEFCVENRSEAGPEILDRQYRRGREAFLSLIGYGVQRGEFSVPNPQGAAATILFLVEGLRMAGQVMGIPEKTLADLLEQIRGILGVRP